MVNKGDIWVSPVGDPHPMQTAGGKTSRNAAQPVLGHRVMLMIT